MRPRMVEQLLIINGGSSSIKYALYESPALRRVMKGKVERIGLPGSAADHEEAIQSVIEAIEKETAGGVAPPKKIGAPPTPRWARGV